MGWIIFTIYMVLGISINIAIHMEKEADTAKGKRIAHIIVMTLIWIAIGIASAFLLLVVGWVWYYICGGFLIECTEGFFWKAIWGLASLVILGFILGFICIIFGFDPK